MPEQICIKCERKTRSVIQTDKGHVCYTCYTGSNDPYKAKRVISHEEADIQTEFFEKLKLFFPTLPDKLIFAVPNGGSRNGLEAANLKRQGVKPGVADVILLVPSNGFSSLCMEFKTKTGKQTADQIEFMKQAIKNRSKYVIVRSAAEGIEAKRKYFFK